MANKKHPHIARSQKSWMQTMERRMKKQARAAKQLRTAFGMHSQSAPPIDAALSFRLRGALQQIDFDLNEACQQRGILSAKLSDALHMAGFLACVLPMARAAQSLTGIPASLLVAEAYLHTAGDATTTNDVFKTGKEFSSLLDAFIDRATTLKHNRKLKGEIMRDRDVQSYISQHDLRECDSLKALGY